jgi:hypothetical protein
MIEQERFEVYDEECVLPYMNVVGLPSIVILDNGSSHMFQLFTNVGISVILLTRLQPHRDDIRPVQDGPQVWVEDRSVRWVIRRAISPRSV